MVWQRQGLRVVQGERLGAPHGGNGDEGDLAPPLGSWDDIDPNAEVDLEASAAPGSSPDAHSRCPQPVGLRERVVRHQLDLTEPR